MVLTKLSEEKIANIWKVIDVDSPGFLYRGNSQGEFEKKFLESSIRNKSPFYHGTITPSEGEITFCSAYLVEALLFARDYAKETIKDADNLHRDMKDYGILGGCNTRDNLGFPLALFPLVMKINAQKYADRLFYSTQGEGLVIPGFISADDIEIIYSNKCDKLEKEFTSIHELEIGSYAIRGLEDLASSLPKASVVDNCRHDPRAILTLHALFNGMSHKSPTDEELESLKEALSNLEKKLAG